LAFAAATFLAIIFYGLLETLPTRNGALNKKIMDSIVSMVPISTMRSTMRSFLYAGA